MAAVAVGGIKKAETVVVAVEQKIRKTFDAECGLVRMMAYSDSAGAHGKTAGLDPGFAEGHGIGCAKFARKRFEG
jgi:hypothetical protein